MLTVSNTFLITEAFLDWYMKRNKLQLTLDSMCEEEHDASRGRGNFQKVTQVIDYCCKNGYADNILLRHNVIRGNEKDLQKFCR